MQKLACPKCHLPLQLDGKSLKCENKHTYDIAKQGYINLLLNQDKACNLPGDNKESLLCRKHHLNKGYYDLIAQSVIDTIKEYRDETPMHLLDLGSGEGYYTYKFKQAFPNDDLYGLDISKDGVAMSTKYTKDICWIVGNSKNIPIQDHSLDFITALFTVVNVDELKRCLKEGGYVVHITANNHHLIEFKEVIYEEVKIKSDEFIRLPFETIISKDIKQTIHLENREDTLNLLKMTPHFYHIKKERRYVLDELEDFDVTIDIKLTLYKV